MKGFCGVLGLGVDGYAEMRRCIMSTCSWVSEVYSEVFMAVRWVSYGLRYIYPIILRLAKVWRHEVYGSMIFLARAKLQ